MNLSEIAAKLAELRQKSDSGAMEIAPLMIMVKDGEMYKETHKSFADFCTSLKYDHSTVYTWIQCYQIPELRHSYVSLGALVSKRLVQAYKHLDADVWDNLLDTCKTLSSTEAIAAIKAARDAAQTTTPELQTPVETTLSLAQALRQQSTLLLQETELKRQLAECQTELARITAIVAEMSVSDRSEKAE